MRTLSTLIAALALGCGPGSAQNAPVATVDGAPIELGALRSAVETRAEEDPEADREDVLSDELNRFLAEQVILNRARVLGVEVLDDEVEARLRQLHGNDFGDADPEYREEIRRQMTLDRTAIFDLGDRVRVPESALVLYFQEHRERFSEPERVRVRQIVVEEREKAQQIRSRLKRGEDFAQLASDYSLAPEASEGGLLPPFAEGEMPEAFDQAFRLKPGQLSKVVESPFGFHVFKLEERVKPRNPEYAEVREKIVLELERERLDDLRRDWLKGLQRQAEIQVNENLLETLR